MNTLHIYHDVDYLLESEIIRKNIRIEKILSELFYADVCR